MRSREERETSLPEIVSREEWLEARRAGRAGGSAPSPATQNPRERDGAFEQPMELPA